MMYVKEGRTGLPGAEPHTRGEGRAERRRIERALAQGQAAKSDHGRMMAARNLELARRRHLVRPLGPIAVAA
jgi:hypothetical protein